MVSNQRRKLSLLLAASLFPAGSLLAQTAPTAEPAAKPKRNPKPASLAKPLAELPVTRLGSKLKILIPANPGGGWDQTGRALGAALIDAGAVDEVEYENKGGKGGTIGLAYFVEKHNSDPNALLIGGSVMLGAIALNNPAIDLSKVAPVARLTTDFLVVAVRADSMVKTAADLAVQLKTNPAAVRFAGGSAGGIDHVFAGMLIRAAGSKPNTLAYQPFSSGPEVVSALVKGSAEAAISSYGELRDAASSGAVRLLGISAGRGAFGLASFKEQGINVELTNWRGALTGGAVAAERSKQMADALRQMSTRAAWRATLKKNNWESALLTGSDLRSNVDFDMLSMRAMIALLSLK